MPDDFKDLAGASASVLGNQSSPHYPPSILAALHMVMTKCGYVQKQGFNDFHKYKYAGESDLLEVLRPAMVEAGLLLIPSGETLSPIDVHGNVFVTVHYTLAHKDGAVWPEKISVFGAGNDRNKTGNVGDKGLYKALTGANKYLLFKLFQIETGDDPEKDSAQDKPDSATGEFISLAQEQKIADLIKETKADTARFLDYLGARAIYEIPVSQFGQAINALEAKKKQVAT